MKKSAKISTLLLAVLLLSSLSIFGNVVRAANDASHETVATEETVVATEDSSKGAKAIASGIAIGLVGLGGAIAMGMAISKSADGISRQPEAEGKIRSAMMIGLVFIETVVIYALIVAILIIFVL